MKAFGEQVLVRKKPYGKLAHNQSFLLTEIRMFDLVKYLDIELVQKLFKNSRQLPQIIKNKKDHSLK